MRLRVSSLDSRSQSRETRGVSNSAALSARAEDVSFVRRTGSRCALLRVRGDHGSPASACVIVALVPVRQQTSKLITSLTLRRIAVKTSSPLHQPSRFCA